MGSIAGEFTGKASQSPPTWSTANYSRGEEQMGKLAKGGEHGLGGAYQISFEGGIR